MIVAKSLTRRFGDFVAVEDLSLEVEAGEVFGILGPNGAGKTTTVRMLTALIAPTSGSATLNGLELGAANQAIRAAVGVLTEVPGHYARLTGPQNLAFYAKLHGLDDIQPKIQRYLEMLGLWEHRTTFVAEYSKGMRQKLAIARCLIHEPPILFLDEPTSALDPASARVVRDFIAELTQEGRTIVICTHNLDEAGRLCDRIGILKKRFLTVDTPANLTRSLGQGRVIVKLASVADTHLAAVKNLPFVRFADRVDQTLHVDVDDPALTNPELIRALVGAGAEVQFVEEASGSLEQAYLELVADDGDEEAAP